MGGKTFWASTSGTTSIMTCALSNCGATTQPIVTGIADTVVAGPNCDTTANEIVWVTQSSSFFFTIFRASTTGANTRSITSFSQPNDPNYWSLPIFTDGRSDRVFYYENTTTTGVAYYVATVSTNTTPVSVATFSGYVRPETAISILAGPSIALMNGVLPSSYAVYSAPLPNGVLGSPPQFVDGSIHGGVVDDTSFYGVIQDSATLPSDALIRCPLTGCSSPVLLGRGQATAQNFAQDATSVYWTVNSTTSIGFSIWKVVK
jgi:hypothetical protein